MEAEPTADRTCPLCNGTGALPATQLQDTTLFDPPTQLDVDLQTRAAQHRNARTAEQLARLALEPHVGSLRRAVLELALQRGDVGITTWEAAEAIVRARFEHVPHNDWEAATHSRLYSVAPRLTELVDGGWLRDSDDVRDRRMVRYLTAKARELTSV